MRFLRHGPNAISFSRILVIPFMVHLISTGRSTEALMLHLVCSIGDGLDGWLARRYRWVSSTGSVLDALSDKIYSASIFVVLALMGKCPIPYVALVITIALFETAGAIAFKLRSRTSLIICPSLYGKLGQALQFLWAGVLIFLSVPTGIVQGICVAIGAVHIISFSHYVHRHWPMIGLHPSERYSH